MFEAHRQRRFDFRRLAQRIRVPAGFVLAPLLMIAARPTAGSLAAGIAVSVVGLSIRAWASGHLKKNAELATTGPYAFTRNPLYLGTFILGTGAAISTGAIWFIALFMALYLLIYVPVMMAEAETVAKLFPERYGHYSRQVPIFFPRLTPYRALDSGGDGERRAKPGKSFDASLYLRHREYRAALGLVAVYALLALKWLIGS